MCGICGRYNFRGDRPVEHSEIERMTSTLVHRGPDDKGHYTSGPIGLGFRRLSIIDLQGGKQPMSDEDGLIWIVFNGEIYNFPELRHELMAKGHQFRTNSDTEVIIYGYKEWGEEVFDHLNGMFGLAIWDSLRKKLILARDAMGIKLVYYLANSNTIYFGSEIRAILSALSHRPNIDLVALNLFLRYRYTPSPLTIFENIKKLAPGTMLIVENGGWRIKRWYNYKPCPFHHKKPIDEAKSELLDIYKNAVKRHLISDVPVGLLLSGGIDSALLLGLMNLHGTSWPTFTVGYGESFKDDELKDALETAEVFSANHTEVRLDRQTFERNLPKIVRALEEPIASSSIVPMYFVCQRAKADVKVALVGQGPDELFGGYRRHLGVCYGSYWRHMPEWFRNAAGDIIRALPRNETLKRGVQSLDIPDRLKRYQNVFSLLPGHMVDSLFRDGTLEQASGDRILECWSDLVPLMENTDELGGLQFLEIRSSLPDELLMYADKLSMAHGLEVRVPYLDREIVEYVERLNADYKVKRGRRKRLHREVCKEFLPSKILRRKKRGFAVNVVDDWFHDSVNERMENILLDESSKMYAFLKPGVVHQLLKEHVNGRNDNHKILFSLVLFEEWMRSQYEG